MSRAVLRKLRRLAEDPVLRRWAAGRALGRQGPPPRFVAHRPPYLDGHLPPTGDPAPPLQPAAPFRPLHAAPAARPIALPLPGAEAALAPGEAAALFERSFTDTETLLAVYRFAWLPLLGGAADPGWVDGLWRAFMARFAVPDEGWAWHPYTAAERAINILDYARRHDLPGERDATLSFLARHATAIARRLEYFGDHDTSNHLANNGRGLYRLGLALGLVQATELGQRILLAEAARIFRGSGVLREGSTHYHLLLARNYADAWLAARAHGRAEAEKLAEIVRRALAVLPHLVLPGGMPLIGDISPDCPPSFLSGLLPGGDMDGGWCGLLDRDSRSALAALMSDIRTISPDRLGEDGWFRVAAGPWSTLLHVAPGGWPPMPGHAHQDLGSFELHHGRQPLFVDPGRGAYGEAGEAGWYVGAAAHNALLIDGLDPFPANKPYYDDGFRRRICGAPPRVVRRRDGIEIAHNGFTRLGGIGEARRRLVLEDGAMTILDRVEGSRTARITRRLHTPLPVTPDGDDVLIGAGDTRFRLRADGPIAVTEGKRWTAYGVAQPARVIDVAVRTALPTMLRLTVEVV